MKELINNKNKFIRLLILTIPLYLGIFFLSLANFYTILGIFFLSLAYFFRNKIWLLLILAVPALTLGQFINFEIRPGWIYELSLTELFIFVAAVIFLIDKFINRKLDKIKFDFLSFILSAYLIISIASFWQIIDFRLYIYGLKIIVFGFLGYFLALNLLNSKKRIEYFIYSLVVTVVILSIQVFIKFYQTGLSSSFFFNRNDIGIAIGPIAIVSAILVMLLPILLAFYFYKQTSAPKPVILFIFITGCLAVFLTLGKAAILSLFLGLFYLFIKIKDKRVAFILAFCLFILSGFLFFNSFFEGLFFRLGRVFIDTSSQFRLLEYKACLEIISDNLWFGVGAGQQIIYYAKNLLPDYRQQVNNFFLQFLIDLGIIGLIILFSIIIGIYKNIKNIFKKVNKKEAIMAFGFTASLVCVFLNGLAEVTIFALPYAIIFWLIAGTFANLVKLKE